VPDLHSWIASLPAHWTDGCSAPVWEKAFASYRSPGRVYHAWDHVEACVETLRSFPCERPRNVFLALLFHDAIYVPGARDNERLSAELATNALAAHSSLAEKDRTSVARMIEATRHHRIDGEGSADMGATLDIDMSILGAPWDDYRAYAEGVRREYCPAVTTPNRFTVGRVAFLRDVLAGASIFHTAEGMRRWEAAARGNIEREIAELRAKQGLLGRMLTALFGSSRA
jgi:predicted metal-dependent HD superfamily phosphohydrolase